MSRRTPTYDEIYMRELISESFKLSPLNLGDKPDMISHDKMLGIEVAACIPEEKRKANSLIEKQYHSQLKENESLWLYHYKKNKPQLKSGPDNKLYVKILKERWIELRPSFERLITYIDSLDNLIRPAAVEDQMKWNHQEPARFDTCTTYDSGVNTLRRVYEERIVKLDSLITSLSVPL